MEHGVGRAVDDGHARAVVVGHVDSARVRIHRRKGRMVERAGNRLDDRVRRRVDDTDRLTALVGHIQPVCRRVQRQIGLVRAARANPGRDGIGEAVNDRDTATWRVMRHVDGISAGRDGHADGGGVDGNHGNHGVAHGVDHRDVRAVPAGDVCPIRERIDGDAVRVSRHRDGCDLRAGWRHPHANQPDQERTRRDVGGAVSGAIHPGPLP